MDKYDYIEGIITYIKSRTGINFQLEIKEILRVYYNSFGKTYEMPDFYGGDQKNDGWVVEDGIFYQIFAPTRLKESLKTEMQNKFKEDLEGLLKIIYVDKKWNCSLKEFVFIVNTFDGNLPHDSERFYETMVKCFKDKYNIDFKYKVTNVDYIRDILDNITDVNILVKMSSVLRVRNIIDANAITEKMIMDLIINISGNLNEKIIVGNLKNDYERVSSPIKIEINDLNDKKEEIENIISNLDVVEKAIKAINQDVLSESEFERVKQFIIEKYNELAKLYHGVELYNKLVEETFTHTNGWNLMAPIKFLIIYIFDKCDIFEKEGAS